MNLLKATHRATTALPLLLCAAAPAATLQDAPPAAAAATNPAQGQAALLAGGTLYAAYCSRCHGPIGEGSGNIPALSSGAAQAASDGALFWMISAGNVAAGMPAWDQLPAVQRWQIVTLIKALPGLLARDSRPIDPAQQTTTDPALPRAEAPFSDYRDEAPGRTHHIGIENLPAPYATASAGNAPRVVPRPPGAWPKAPPGFVVTLYASGLENPRLLRRAPNGDILVAETAAGRIRLLRGVAPDGTAQSSTVLVSGLNRPFGIAFYPLGDDPQWLYVADTDAVLRFPYRSGDVTASGPAQQLADLPASWLRGHSTRDLQFSKDGRQMFVSVGSDSNVSDPDSTPAEAGRADILSFTPDGGDRRIYAAGIRNPVGLAIDPASGALWCSVNERDGLGDNLVPDYITHVEAGGFYGWPWWYSGAHQDPRHSGKHPELRDRTLVPDVLLQPHNASLQLAFYDGAQFPAAYHGDIFAAEHGSWNRGVRTGYEVIRVPLTDGHATSGGYEDFLTGFVLDNERVWGRPVGVAVDADGALLVSDDASGSIWRVSVASSR